jgi:26S proteasome regulatory subunit (ATPase 3-interacting protein)
MAPRKKIEEKASANEAADMVLLYLRKSHAATHVYNMSCWRLHSSRHFFFLFFYFSHVNPVYPGKQNRPYSAIDVSANLHNKVTKGVFRFGKRG